MQPQPMITCTSVPLAREWYETVVDLEPGHGGDDTKC
jgi:hypothetical protein